MSTVQSNISLISSWITLSSSYHQFQKKYMIVSRKSSSFLTSLSPLFLDGSQLEQVNLFKYLGIIITSNLSWSPHIHFVCSKLVNLLESSTVTSISMLHLILFSLCIALLSFPIFSTTPLFGTHPYLPLILKFSRKPFSQLLTF